jgi:multidrug efflux system membrane fusion protein
MHAPHDKPRTEQKKSSPGSVRRWARSEFATVALLVGLLGVAGGLAWWNATATPPAAAPDARAAKKGGPRPVSVFVARAAQKDMPFRVEAIATVQPMVSVAVRSRVDSQVVAVHFEDGAAVKAGDLLYTLDSRAIDAQIRQFEATLSRDRAQLAKAKRDLERIAGLVERNTLSPVQLADARTNVDVLTATVEQGEAQVQNLRVQRSYFEIRSPATGRIGASGVRPGAVVRASDAAPPLATVNQLSPIYVAFGLPERYLADLRAANDRTEVEATLQNEVSIGGGRVAFVDNTVDPQTATVQVRAVFENKDERLWPGTLASVRLTLRTDAAQVVVPTEAVQSGQRGTFVFVIEKGVSKVRPVKVARTLDGEAIIAEGLEAGETVVTDGQLSLRDGTRIAVRPKG